MLLFLVLMLMLMSLVLCLSHKWEPGLIKNFIDKFSYKLKFTEYDLVIKVIMIMIIIIFKKTYLQFISTTKKKERLFSNTISVGGDYFQAKCSCEEIEKKKQMA